MRVTNQTRGTILADRAWEAVGFFQRFRGLMGRPDLEVGEGLWIEPCNSIHMFFMRFPIDVLFLDAHGQVVRFLPQLAPWRVSGLYPKARGVLELPAGVGTASGTQEGDTVRLERV